jgi:hypothetical protein
MMIDRIETVHLWTDCSVFTGRLYDQAFVQRCKGGDASGGFASGQFNGKEVSCAIVPRRMGRGRWSSTTRWKVDGKQVALAKLIQTIVGPL